MPDTSAQVLGRFAAELSFSDIPPAVIERAKDGIIDTAAVATFGAQFPWSRMMVDYARRYGSGGPCSIFGNKDIRVHAPGIAGSLSSGILAFTKSEQGAMVKRMHLGRASESGILAARLAGEGYTGPETVLEGKFGFLEVYCRDGDPKLLTANLHKDWETLRILTKRYPSQLHTQTPVQSVRELMDEHAFQGTDVASIVVEGGERLLSHHNITEPGDIMQAQYSVPFCVALALFRDPENPNSFDTSALEDPVIRAACRNVEVRARPQGNRSIVSTRVTVRLKNGREFAREGDSFKGMPERPLSRADLRRRFMLTAGTGDTAAARLFERLENLEAEPHFSLR